MSNENTNAVAKTTTQAIEKGVAQKTIKDLLNSPQFKDQVALALPKHLSPDRFIRVALTTMMRTPMLAQCDQTSFFNSLMTLSQVGLEPDGTNAYLIPFNNTKRNCVECQLIVSYRGLLALAMRTGKISNIHADKVCVNDVFTVDRGEIKEHKVDYSKPRGDAYAYYCLIRFKDGTEKSEVMTRAEVEAIRKRSRAGSSGPWVTDFDEMSKKTVFRRASKWIELSGEMREAMDKDDDRFPDIHTPSAPVKIEPVKLELSTPVQAPVAKAQDAIVVDDEIPSELSPVVKEEEAGSDEKDAIVDSIFDVSTGPAQVKKACQKVGIDFSNIRTAPVDAIKKVQAIVEKEAASGRTE